MILPDSVSIMLILKRASNSRPTGTWSDDDYDVFDGSRHTGQATKHKKNSPAEAGLSVWEDSRQRSWCQAGQTDRPLQAARV